MQYKHKRIAFISVALSLSIVIGVAAQSVIGKVKIQNSANTPEELSFAHGVTVDNNGEFVFKHDGVTYKNEWERLQAEDGFMYGVDWDWFGTWQQNRANFGYDNIIKLKSQYKEAQVERALYNLKALGFNCWSNWIGPIGMFTYDDDGFVTGLEPTFTENLEKLLTSCRRVGIDFVPGLLSNWFGSSDGNTLIDGLTNQERAHKFFRYYYDDEAREAYINNGIKPVCQILSKYQDVIPVIALSIENGSVTNDPSVGMIYSSNGAVTWEDFAALQNAMHDAVKEAMPNMLTSTEDIGGWQDNMYKYNDLKVDILGYNYYTSGNFPDMSDQILTRPAYLGEMDVFHDHEDYANVTEAYLSIVRSQLYEKAVKSGYKGAFFYPFFYNEMQSKGTFYSGSSTDRSDQIRDFVVNMAYSIIDLKNEHRGKSGSKDVAVLLYNNGSKDLYWLGGRNVDHFILERRDNGGAWKVINDSISVSDNMIDNGLIKYTDETIAENVSYEYRVTAVFESGEKTVSGVGNKFELFIPQEEFVDSNGNYAGGFEQGGLTGSNVWPNSNGWYKEFDWMPELGIFKKGDSRTGDYSFFVDVPNGIGVAGEYSARWRYNLTLKPNTQYTLSMWSKDSNVMYGVTIISGSGEQLIWTYPAGGEEGVWTQREISFTSPSDGKIAVRLSNININSAYVNLDDISIKESR